MGAKSPSHKTKNKENNIKSNVETHSLATLDLEKVKRKDISNGENLLVVLKDGRFDTLPRYYQERSSILIKPIEEVTIGTVDLNLAIYLSKLGRQKYSELFKRRQIKRWLYADIPGFDLDLIIHHLNISPGIGINNGTQHGL